ncbi:putative metal-binding motif-containing protein [Lacinutrix gracilariae]|uniref:Metal-binding motif-containing protein n=1 Tax=Lacinutrix gracilariae TaxID=1747198 RepID=A0ABW5K1H7_9FLAO
MRKKNLINVITLLTIGLLSFYSCSDSDDACTEQTWYQDADGDGFGNENIAQQSCTQPSGYVTDNTDFDDSNASAFPNATELCNGIDDNGNGIIDENTTDCAAGEVCENGTCVTAITYYRDSDGDDYGDNNNSIIAGSMAPTGYVTDNTDCNDTEASINPGANEIPNNNIDDNCNGIIDGCTSNTACDDGNPLTFDVCIDEVCYHYYGTQCNNDSDCAQGQTCVDIGGGISVCQ